jgi:hypothetical protein
MSIVYPSRISELSIACYVFSSSPTDGSAKALMEA